MSGRWQVSAALPWRSFLAAVQFLKPLWKICPLSYDPKEEWKQQAARDAKEEDEL